MHELSKTRRGGPQANGEPQDEMGGYGQETGLDKNHWEWSACIVNGLLNSVKLDAKSIPLAAKIAVLNSPSELL